MQSKPALAWVALAAALCLGFCILLRIRSPQPQKVPPIDPGFPSNVRVSFVDGTSATMDGGLVRYRGAGAVQPTATQYELPPVAILGHRPRNGRLWLYMFELEGPTGKALLKYGFFDKEGRPIDYVDLKGNPISQALYEKDLPQALQPNPPMHPVNRAQHYFNAWTQPQKPGAKLWLVLSNVNPATVGQIGLVAKP